MGGRGAGDGTSFGTPTVAVDGMMIDTGAPRWLHELSPGRQPPQ